MNYISLKNLKFTIGLMPHKLNKRRTVHFIVVNLHTDRYIKL